MEIEIHNYQIFMKFLRKITQNKHILWTHLLFSKMKRASLMSINNLIKLKFRIRKFFIKKIMKMNKMNLKYCSQQMFEAQN